MSEQILTITAALLLALLLTAAVSDLRSHRIPNWVCAGILLLGFMAQCAEPGWTGPLRALAGPALALLCLLPFYARRAVGAGDVKLLAAAGAWLGPLGVTLAAGVTLLSGLLLAVAGLACRYLLARQPMLQLASRALPQPLRLSLMVERGGRLKLPYGLAIAVGSTFSAWHFGKLLPLVNLAH